MPPAQCPASPKDTKAPKATGATSAPKATIARIARIATVPGMPAVLDAGNLYSETRSGQMLPAVKKDLERVYVPNLRGNSVTVIDPTNLKVVDSFKVRPLPAAYCSVLGYAHAVGSQQCRGAARMEA